MNFAKDAGQGLGLRWSDMVFRGCNLKIVSRISPGTDRSLAEAVEWLIGPGRGFEAAHTAPEGNPAVGLYLLERS